MQKLRIFFHERLIPFFGWAKVVDFMGFSPFGQLEIVFELGHF
jgi:hypothetical protein